ncbi:uncharacterized protein LOC115968223 [Quercus lobata]|uniref:uncharacterized protein LOC115968223 n=1 Tax=Quercus lobata TaxID=97700 RepID=UPI0012469311|nr:uncharacterized protein LOC115968223 [Quercus lobata]
MERSLSREEKEELVRSTKKVKNVSHAGFGEGHSSGSASPNRDGVPWNLSASFRDKLLGEIPGAFAQAFSFEDGMDDEVESDGEIETLRQGLLAVKIPKELKQRIRKLWTSAFIVKVYDRSVGLNFIQGRLLALWKPAGRLDCVDLGHGFFLTRLSLSEDYENVLRKEALQLIGKAIGNVLRIDTFTASETRGRFARLCVQVDVEKPLAIAIMIGKLEQQICYEGIQKMCFECGRLGHSKEHCPHVVWQGPSYSEAELKEAGETCFSSRSTHVPDKARRGEGTSGVMRDFEQSTEKVDVREEVYGPWIVVKRRKNSTNPLRSGGTLPRQGSGMNTRTTEYMEKGIADRAAGIDGSNRESKRKMSPQSFVDKARFASVVQSIKQKGKAQTQQSPSLMLNRGVSSQNLDRSSFYPNSQRLTSVKGKKGAAHKKSHNDDQGSAVGAQSSHRTGFKQAQVSAVLVGVEGQSENGDGQFRFGGLGGGDGDGVCFTASAGSSRGDSRELGFCPGQVLSKADQIIGASSAFTTQGDLVGEQIGVGASVEHRELPLSEDSEVNGGMQAVGGVFASNISSQCAMEDCETEGMEFEARGGFKKGALKPSFRKRVTNLVQNYNPSILVVMETRVGGDRAREITNLLPFDGAFHIDSIGYAGGLWVLWNADRVDLALLASTEQAVHAEVKVMEWNKNQFGNIFTRKKNLMSRLNGIQRSLALRPLEFLVNLEDGLLRELDLVLRQEEELWALKSRVNWMIQGDRNTTFYHVSTLVRSKRNKIMAIKNTVGDWIIEEGEIKDFIRSGYEQIFLSSLSSVPRMDPAGSQCQPRLSELEKESISGGPSKDEVKATL